MLLALDVGNTNTVFAVFEDGVLKESWRCKTVGARSADEYAAFLYQLFQMSGIKWHDISSVIVSSVVPAAAFHIDRLANKYIGCAPMFVNANNAQIEIDIDRAGELGADRIVNAAAVIEHYQVPCVVIDFGTATTFDVIDKNGVYSGGVIAPGVRLSIEALHKHAAKLPKVRVARPENIIGKNTAEAMQSGLYWGYIGMIEGVIGKIKDDIGGNLYVLATGGLAGLYAKNTDIIHAIDENLTLKGLLKIHNVLNNK